MIKEFVDQNYEPSPATRLLRRAHKYLEEKDTRSSFIEGVSSLELAIEEFLRSNCRVNQLSDSVNESLAEFF
ncbi:MAG: hypothetical protein WBX01_14580 [Nitrososphaeraceae archaeon]